MRGNRTLIVINRMSGNASAVNEDFLRFFIDPKDEIHELKLTEQNQDYDVTGYSKLVVFGGDGTINNALNKCKDKDIDIFCFPCGTFNEKAKSLQVGGDREIVKLPDMGRVNDELFTYVCAVGSFTEIGYVTNEKAKKKFKLLAYLTKVLSSYKVHNIKAKISAGSKKLEGNYTLVMVIDSNRCFGFNFNKCYDPNDKRMSMLLIKNTGKNNFAGKVKMFFPFFRTFFIGFKKEYHSKNIDFFPIKSAKISFEEDNVFCLDGEKRYLGRELEIEKLKLKPNFFILKKR